MNKQDKLLLSFNNSLSRLNIDTSRRYVIGVSGGVDSMVLLHCCIELNIPVVVCHINYKKRGIDSDRDELLVADYCIQFEIPFYSIEAPAFKGNFQAAAREFRYSFFEEIAQQNEAAGILTAHHADDRVETFFMNLLRGSSLSGLVNLHEKRANIYRPFIQVSKSAILEFAQKNSILFREDKSNTESVFTRNKIRNEVLPLLYEHDPAAQQNIHKSIKFLEQTKQAHLELIELELDKHKETRFGIRFFKRPSQLSEALRLELYYHLFSRELGVEPSRIKNIEQLQSGSMLEGSSTQVFISTDGFWIVDKKRRNFDQAFPGYDIILNDKTEMENSDSIVLSNELFEASVFRAWQPGDRMIISDSGQSKKVQDIFVDSKIPVPVRKNLPILAKENGKVLWIPFVRVSNELKQQRGSEIKLTVQTINKSGW